MIRRARAIVLGLALALACTSIARAEELEPPPEAPEGVDWSVERADSLADGEVELGLGAGGRFGSAPRRTKRVRFRGGDLAGALREGDALAGGRIEADAGGGRLGVGPLAPRWGRGLLLGAAADPWTGAPLDRGTRAAYRGRAGEGATFRAGDDARVEALAGRFARRDLAGLRLGRGPFELGGLASRGGSGVGSVGIGFEAFDAELAFARRGRWRAEAGIARAQGRWAMVGHARGGHSGFRSLAEPKRSGPSRAIAITARHDGETLRSTVHGALWRFGRGEAGARGALEVERRFDQHAALVCGFEEQHGPRREAAVRATSLRQGWWSEWRGETPSLSLAVRDEIWGARAWGRSALRRVVSAEATARLPGGASLRVRHSEFQARAGENLYLAESEGDRLLLRAVSGAGTRTLVQADAPAGGGHVRVGVQLARRAERSLEPVWTLEWSRRSRR